MLPGFRPFTIREPEGSRLNPLNADPSVSQTALCSAAYALSSNKVNKAEAGNVLCCSVVVKSSKPSPLSGRKPVILVCHICSLQKELQGRSYVSDLLSAGNVLSVPVHLGVFKGPAMVPLQDLHLLPLPEPKGSPTPPPLVPLFSPAAVLSEDTKLSLPVSDSVHTVRIFSHISLKGFSFPDLQPSDLHE